MSSIININSRHKDARDDLKAEIMKAKAGGASRAWLYISVMERMLEEYEAMEKACPWHRKRDRLEIR